MYKKYIESFKIYMDFTEPPSQFDYEEEYKEVILGIGKDALISEGCNEKLKIFTIRYIIKSICFYLEEFEKNENEIYEYYREYLDSKYHNEMVSMFEIILSDTKKAKKALKSAKYNNSLIDMNVKFNEYESAEDYVFNYPSEILKYMENPLVGDKLEDIEEYTGDDNLRSEKNKSEGEFVETYIIKSLAEPSIWGLEDIFKYTNNDYNQYCITWDTNYRLDCSRDQNSICVHQNPCNRGFLYYIKEI